MEDNRIVELYWQRDEAAIDHTQKKYGPYLHKIAWNILSDREDAGESVNDTYLAAWNSMPPQRPSVLATYLGKLTRRISIDRFRRRTAEKRGAGEYALSLEELEDCTGKDTTAQQLELQALADSIAAFLRCQNAQTRHVFVSRYYYMDSVKEIAANCRITESKVKVLLYRTRQALKNHLEEEGFAI